MRAAVPWEDNDKRHSLSDDKLLTMAPSCKLNVFRGGSPIMMLSSMCLEFGRGIKTRRIVPSSKPMYRVRSAPASGTNVIPVMSRAVSLLDNVHEVSNCTPGAQSPLVGRMN